MDGFITTPSLQLVEANRRLHALRATAQTQRLVGESPNGRVSQAESLAPWDVETSQKTSGTAETIAALPKHLGWGGEALTAVLRQSRKNAAAHSAGCFEPCRETEKTANNNNSRQASNPYDTNANPQSPIPNLQSPDWVKLYPDIGLAMLRQEVTAPGRLWLLLRYLDQDGSGLIRIDIIRKSLTEKNSNTRLCGKRQLRNLLKDGEGLFWTRDKVRIWLHSAARVAHTLKVERLVGKPVALPISAMLDGIGKFRAHLYGAFHSGRTKETRNGKQAMPIARDTLSSLSGMGRSSQRTYEQNIGVRVQVNYGVGTVYAKENKENYSWEKGRTLFELKDYRGQQGKKGKTYLAWQLPNTYIGQHRHRPRGRQKRINRKLKDLVMKGMPGNVGEMSEMQKPEKVYYPNGKLAAKAYGRDSERELYWKRHKPRNGCFDLWQQLGDR